MYWHGSTLMASCRAHSAAFMTLGSCSQRSTFNQFETDRQIDGAWESFLKCAQRCVHDAGVLRPKEWILPFLKLVTDKWKRRRKHSSSAHSAAFMTMGSCNRLEKNSHQSLVTVELPACFQVQHSTLRCWCRACRCQKAPKGEKERKNKERKICSPCHTRLSGSARQCPCLGWQEITTKKKEKDAHPVA